MKIGELIKKYRKMKGMSQEKLGHIIGVSDGTISNWETSKRLPDAKDCKQLAEVLGCNVMELLSVLADIENESQNTETIEEKVVYPEEDRAVNIADLPTNNLEASTMEDNETQSIIAEATLFFKGVEFNNSAMDIIKLYFPDILNWKVTEKSISNFLRYIVSYIAGTLFRIPKIAEYTQGLIDAIAYTLPNTKLDTDKWNIANQWSALIIDMSELLKAEELSPISYKKGIDIIDQLYVSRVSDSDELRLKVVKEVIYFIKDNWLLFTHYKVAYYIINRGLCVLDYSSFDDEAFNRVVRRFNDLAVVIYKYDILLHYRDFEKVTD